MNSIGRKLSSNKAITVHSLIAAAAYLICITMMFINIMQSSVLLIIFFFVPAIFCGSAVILIKQMRQWREGENYKAIGITAAVNTVIAIISVFFAADIIINFI